MDHDDNLVWSNGVEEGSPARIRGKESLSKTRCHEWQRLLDAHPNPLFYLNWVQS